MNKFLVHLTGALLFTLLSFTSFRADAGDVVLSNNSGTDSTTWAIQGEPSVVITGFNLNDKGITRPAAIDRVSIDVSIPLASQNTEVLVYEDPDGGSPANASLAGRATVTIGQAGVYTHTFETPVQITQPVVWVGFYLPVGLEFRADTSGSSVLTYWAWEPGTTFDPANLGAVSVLGPADGSAPVNINMGGVARITAEVVTDGTPSTGSTTTDTPETVRTDDEERILQVTGSANTDFSPMVAYDDCPRLAYDAADISASYDNGIRVFCKSVTDQYAPPPPDGYSRRGDIVYDFYLFGIESAGSQRLPYGITHCMVPGASERDTGVLGLAYGTPRKWEILPTVRFGEVLCAEMFYSGDIAIFTPN